MFPFSSHAQIYSAAISLNLVESFNAFAVIIQYCLLTRSAHALLDVESLACVQHTKSKFSRCSVPGMMHFRI